MLVGLVTRVAASEGADVRIHIRNAEGGSGRALDSLKRYSADFRRGIDRYLDILVVAIDGNCHGWLKRRQEIEAAVGSEYPGQLVVAIPDPHVELWYLADRTAVARVLEENFAAEVPPMKCERNRYKDALRTACRRAGVEPTAGGVEYGDEIAAAMDLRTASGNDESIGRFLDDLEAAIRQNT